MLLFLVLPTGVALLEMRVIEIGESLIRGRVVLQSGETAVRIDGGKWKALIMKILRK